MNPRQKVLESFNFIEVRPVPYHIWCEDGVIEMLSEHYNREWHIKNSLYRIFIEWSPKKYIGPNNYIDINGTVWREGNIPHIVSPALKNTTIKGFSLPKYATYLKNPPKKRCGIGNGIIESLTFREAKKRIELLGGKYFVVIGYGNGIFQQSCDILGWENYLSNLLMHPKFINDLMDEVLERQLELIDILVDLDCDAIIIADDWADQRGIMMGPELWRKFIKPRVKVLYDKIHSGGKMAFQHVCGNVYEIIPDLIDIGLDCLQSLQPEAMPIYKIKKEYGRHLRLWGGLGTQSLLTFGSPEEIRLEIRKLKREMGKGGGYIFDSSKPVENNMPIENIFAFFDETIKD